MSPQKVDLTHQQNSSQIWQLVEIAASRVPEWVFQSPSRSDVLSSQIQNVSGVKIRPVEDP